jgi:RNA polymerase primary sigma factor
MAGNGYDGLILYLREIRQLPRLTREEEFALARRVRQGDQGAWSTLVQANLRLVVRIARTYEGLGLPLLDLIAEGNTGLLKAAQRFDDRNGCRFSTYATWAIRTAIIRAIANHGRTIRIPAHLITTVHQLSRIRLKLVAVLEREPSPEEFAVEIRLPLDRIRAILRAMQPTISLHAPVHEGEATTLEDLIEDRSAPSPRDAGNHDLLALFLSHLLATLTPRERRVLELRFGLADGAPRTFEEIGRQFHVTREYIRQVEAKALRRLRHPSRRRQLEEFAQADGPEKLAG